MLEYEYNCGIDFIIVYPLFEPFRGYAILGDVTAIMSFKVAVFWIAQ